tara:strand:+ start:1036 stop:1380 length:345 start_codon:yes stop_codon:yes gene_type:complete
MSEIFIPKWKDNQKNGSQFMKNLERHLRYEVDLEKFEHKKREIECGKENQQGGMLEGVGQLKATIPARDYFRWLQFKPGCWSDKQFVDEYLRDNPACRTKSPDKKVFQGGLGLA